MLTRGKFMRERFFLIIVLVLSGLLLGFATQGISIGYYEAVSYFEENGIVHYLAYYSTKLFGQNDFTLRLPFIILHLCSIVLLYKIGKLFLKKHIDRIVSVAIFALLPGVNSVDILVNIPFTHYFSQISPEEFLEKLKIFSFKCLVVGENYSYGFHGKGNTKT